MADASQSQFERSEAIAKVLADVQASLSAGKPLDSGALAASHPDLMPELGDELQKLARINAAASAAAFGETIAPPSDSEMERLVTAALDRPLDRPQIYAAGYSMLREISRGGQAVVFLALQISTGRNVAIKVMRDGPLADDRAKARFQREVRSLAALNHPNIVTIFDTGKTADGSDYIAMKYVAGSSLDEFMKQWHHKQPDDPSKLLRTFLKICAAVNVAHSNGIIHRDLKPSNIRIDERGEPQILDFGLARVAFDRSSISPEPISITGEFLGSLPWSSPEQAEGDPDRIDARTDVYSLGVILYQMLTGGRFPYSVVGNMRDVLNNILTAAPTPPSKIARFHEVRKPDVAIRPPVNEAIERIVLKALAKDPADRYQSAGKLGRDIRDYLSGRDATATPTAARLGKSSRRASLVAAAVIVPAVLLGMTIMFFAERSEKVTAWPADAVTIAGHHFKVFDEPLSWSAAAARCAEHGGHLAEPVTADALSELQMVKGDDKCAWVGGSDQDGWQWTNAGPVSPELLNANQQPEGADRLVLTRRGRLAGRPNDGRGKSVSPVESYICEWDH